MAEGGRGGRMTWVQDAAPMTVGELRRLLEAMQEQYRENRDRAWRNWGSDSTAYIVQDAKLSFCADLLERLPK